MSKIYGHGDQNKRKRKKGSEQKNVIQNSQHANQNDGWNGFQYIYYNLVKMVQQNQYHKTKHKCSLEDVILLDSGPTIKGTFMNPELINNIKPSKSPLHMYTNAQMNKMTL